MDGWVGGWKEGGMGKITDRLVVKRVLSTRVANHDR